MKRIQWILLVSAVIVMNSCNSTPDAQTLLDKPELRNELMSAIADDHEHMTEFMSVLQNSEHGMQMMQGNQHMMGQMMEGDAMHMMMNDSTNMDNMMQNMLKDGSMMNRMMQKMHAEGLLSEACMQSMGEMMKQHGMDMDDMEGMDHGN